MTKAKVEFGDFQTPAEFAVELVSLLRDRGFKYQFIVEPTCGKGGFLTAASRVFPQAKLLGIEFNEEYVSTAKLALGARAEIRHGSFFDVDWDAILDCEPTPPLFLGNPPWVTNSRLGAMGSSNLPEKNNFKGLGGLDALTGKSNFDISEWMMIKLLETLQNQGGAVAMLCKTAVARKLLRYASDRNLSFSNAAIFGIDAMRVFGAAVDACFFVFEVAPGKKNYMATVYDSHRALARTTTIGIVGGQLVANLGLYELSRQLDGLFSRRWRSGIKHDCSKVMEFSLGNEGLVNGLDEIAEIESDLVFPLLKSSDLANGRILNPTRRILVTQSYTGEDTDGINVRAPRTWQYLQRHSEALDRRQSSIYRGRPRFSIFGIGEYSFAPWKVAISGLYKSLEFQVVPPFEGKPVMLDDTCYFLGSHTEEEARSYARRLRSQTAQDFLNSVVFWDTKRPISADVLQRLDLDRISAG